MLQELWAPAEAIRAEAKKFGYVVAAAEGPVCLAAVLFRPGMGQQLKLPLQGAVSTRVAAAVVTIGGGHGLCCASVYGISNSTAEQKEQLIHAMRATVGEFRAFVRGSCVRGGDLNAKQHELGILSELGRAGKADWGSEHTCVIANSKVPRRIDRVWVSPELQARLEKVELTWAAGLKTHSLQQGIFRSGPADQFRLWQLEDAGPAEDEGSFTDLEFWTEFQAVASQWREASRRQDVDGMWSPWRRPLFGAIKFAAAPSRGRGPPRG